MKNMCWKSFLTKFEFVSSIFFYRSMWMSRSTEISPDNYNKVNLQLVENKLYFKNRICKNINDEHGIYLLWIIFSKTFVLREYISHKQVVCLCRSTLECREHGGLWLAYSQCSPSHAEFKWKQQENSYNRFRWAI